MRHTHARTAAGKTWCRQQVADRYSNRTEKPALLCQAATGPPISPETHPMMRAIATIALLSLAMPLAGCVVAGPGYGPGGRWCYNHPYRCGR